MAQQHLQPAHLVPDRRYLGHLLLRGATATMPAEAAMFFLLPFGQERAAGVGDVVDLLAVGLAHVNKAAILQHLERRVDRAGAGRVHAVGPLLKRLHHFVAMHRALLQQLQQRIFQVAAAEETLAPARPSADFFLLKWFPTTKWVATEELAPHLPTEEPPAMPTVAAMAPISPPLPWRFISRTKL